MSDWVSRVGVDQKFAAGVWHAYTSMWGRFVSGNESMTYTCDLWAYPSSWPGRTRFDWSVTPDPDYNGVNGYLHVAYGNYDWNDGVITSRQLYTVTDLTVSANWTLTGDGNSGLLCEFWSGAEGVQQAAFTKVHEIAFFPRLSPDAITYVSGLPSVGSGWTDANGAQWLVRQGVAGEGQPYYIAYRSGYADHEGPFLFHQYLSYLIGQGKITGNEWFNGLAYGVEPHHGAGSLTIDSLVVSYAGAARVPWTVSNLVATAQSSSQINLTWTAAAGATSHQYRVNGGTWTTTSGPSSQSVTGLTASTAYTFEVRGVNGTGNGATSNTANATTSAPATSNLIGNGTFADDTGWSGFWYSGKSVSGDKAVFTATPAYDGIEYAGIAPTAGKYYELTYTVSGRTSGTVYARLLGGTTRNGTNRSANGTFTERLLVNTGNNTLSILLETGGTLSVDDVSLVGPYNTSTVGGA